MPVQQSWPLVPDPTPSTTPSAAEPTAGALGRTVRPVIRRGLLRPFMRDGKSDLANGTGDDLLESKIGQILGADGELPWRTDFNGNLDRLRHLNNGPALTEFARVYVTDGLARWLPSVRVLTVEATRLDTETSLVIFFERATTNVTQQPQKASVTIPLQK